MKASRCNNNRLILLLARRIASPSLKYTSPPRRPSCASVRPEAGMTLKTEGKVERKEKKVDPRRTSTCSMSRPEAWQTRTNLRCPPGERSSWRRRYEANSDSALAKAQYALWLEVALISVKATTKLSILSASSIPTSTDGRMDLPRTAQCALFTPASTAGAYLGEQRSFVEMPG